MLVATFYVCVRSGAIIFGSDQEVREVMRAVRRNNATGAFSWIGSDGWSARNLVSDGNEPEVRTEFPWVGANLCLRIPITHIFHVISQMRMCLFCITREHAHSIRRYATTMLNCNSSSITPYEQCIFGVRGSMHMFPYVCVCVWLVKLKTRATAFRHRSAQMTA